MKTLYSLGGAPQFRVPCLKYSFLIKEKENKNIFHKSNTIIKDFNNIEEKEKETIVDQWMDQIYPMKSIKRCLSINPTIKVKMRKFYRHLRESLFKREGKLNQEINNMNNNENNYSLNTHLINNNKINLKFILQRNNSNYKESIYNISKYHNKFNNRDNPLKEEDKKIQINIVPSRNIPKINPKDFSGKLFNYYYPILNESNSLDLCQSLITKPKTKRSTQLLSISNNNNNSLTNNSNSKIIFNSQFLNIFENNKTLNENSKSEIKNNKTIASQLKNINTYKKKIKFKKFKFSKSIESSINKRKRRRGNNHQNKLNILYSDNEEQFYKKYDKHRKNKILYGLCLTHINSSPKVMLNELNQKISDIKNKVGVVKSIVDKTFPKVLADITLIKKEYDNSQGKEGYNSPYIQRLNKIKNHQKYMNSFFLDPIKIISRNRKSNFENMKKNSLFNI